MGHQLLFLVLVATYVATAATQTPPSASSSNPTASMREGFRSPTVSYSSSRDAICVAGSIPVPVVATNVRQLLLAPTDQPSTTEFIQELLQAGSTLVQRSNGGNFTVADTFRISARLCYPANLASAAEVQTVQLLTHGVGLDQSYWDIASGFSYVDASARAGYATLSYDRLAVGQSDRPDPVQVVQAFTDVEIEHGLVQILRTGRLARKAFRNIVGVGHSFGSFVKIGTTAKYPEDFDAVILTGFANALQNLPYTILANNPSLARLNDPARFGTLPNGYLVHATPTAIQLPFFRYPFFDQRSNYIATLPSSPFRSHLKPSPTNPAPLQYSLRLPSLPQTNLHSRPTPHPPRHPRPLTPLH